VSELPQSSLRIAAEITYGAFSLAVDERLDIAGVTGLFGPSGSGKSTLLRIVAGIERDATGIVRFGEETWQDDAAGTFVPAWQRPVGCVFQDARLFPHLDVSGNLQYADRRGRDNPVYGFSDVVSALELEDLLPRSVDALSGGERQRVAIGRTLLTRPRLLLLDEPLAAIDVRRKREILPYLESLPARFGIPAIYVSHSAGEIAQLADRVVAMEGGRISTQGNVEAVLGQALPGREEMSFEAVSVLEVAVVETVPEYHLTRVSHDGQDLTIAELAGKRPGERVRLLVRSGDVVLAIEEPRGISVRNVLEATVASVDEIADTAFAHVVVDIGGTRLVARLTRHAVDELGLGVGQPVYALIKTAAFDRASLSIASVGG